MNDILELKRRLDALEAEYYKNNFTGVQDFNKYSRFNFRFKLPYYASDPTVGEVGDLVNVAGKVKTCTVASLTSPTWVVVGTQT